MPRLFQARSKAPQRTQSPPPRPLPLTRRALQHLGDCSRGTGKRCVNPGGQPPTRGPPMTCAAAMQPNRGTGTHEPWCLSPPTRPTAGKGPLQPQARELARRGERRMGSSMGTPDTGLQIWSLEGPWQPFRRCLQLVHMPKSRVRGAAGPFGRTSAASSAGKALRLSRAAGVQSRRMTWSGDPGGAQGAATPREACRGGGQRAAAGGLSRGSAGPATKERLGGVQLYSCTAVCVLATHASACVRMPVAQPKSVVCRCPACGSVER